MFGSTEEIYQERMLDTSETREGERVGLQEKGTVRPPPQYTHTLGPRRLDRPIVSFSNLV